MGVVLTTSDNGEKDWTPERCTCVDAEGHRCVEPTTMLAHGWHKDDPWLPVWAALEKSRQQVEIEKQRRKQFAKDVIEAFNLIPFPPGLRNVFLLGLRDLMASYDNLESSDEQRG